MTPSRSPKTELEKQYMTSSTSNLDPKTKKQIAIAQPSSSILLISPDNQVLLLHRTKTSSAFPSAHVFPGGTLDPFHESPIPEPSSPLRHADSLLYRLCAIRECFEECGILLAHPKDWRNVPLPSSSRSSSSSDDHPRAAKHADNDTNPTPPPPPPPNKEPPTPPLIHIPTPQKQQARSDIYAKTQNFSAWLREIDAEPHTQGLIACTRWITPGNLKKRFTTQMYVYFLPLDVDLGASEASEASGSGAPAGNESGKTSFHVQIPQPDGDEHTAAEFADCGVWLERARRGEVILFPPQFYLLGLVGEVFASVSAAAAASSSLGSSSEQTLKNQRIALRKFLEGSAGAAASSSSSSSSSSTKWADKIICPVGLGVKREDGRVILGLGGAGPEFEGEGEGDGEREGMGMGKGNGKGKGKGDDERVILVRFLKEGPRDLEVRGRGEVLGRAGGGKL